MRINSLGQKFIVFCTLLNFVHLKLCWLDPIFRLASHQNYDETHLLKTIANVVIDNIIAIADITIAEILSLNDNRFC